MLGLLTPRLRLLLGWTLIVIGIPLFILPIPLGVFVLTPGFYLIITSSPYMRRRIVSLKKIFPNTYRKFRSKKK